MSYSYNSYGQPPPLIRPTSGMAVAGFVTALMGLSLVGPLRALRRERPRG